ncbi:MAG: hypothetical protein QOK35_2029 [Pseudonocardiales bacterium]|nr:hypothetical protein [Pseudonocardiales bacterium]
MTRLLLDNEAVQALRDPTHRKHRRVLAFVESTVSRRRGSATPVVPTAVRVEAGWDRRAARSATINRLRIDDAPLDTHRADLAAALVVALRVVVADAHLGAVVAGLSGPVAVLTSDVDDLRRIAAHLDVPVRVVAL